MNLNIIPNIITLLRILLIWPFLSYLLSTQYGPAFIIFLVAGLSDGVDGYLARRYNWVSRLGGFIDVLADKLLLISSFLVLGFLGILPLTLMSLVIARDIFTVLGVSTYYCLFGKLNLKPSIIGKINIAAQILLVFLLLFEAAFFKIPALLIASVVSVMIVASFSSLVEYVWIWSKRTYYEWGNTLESSRLPRLLGVILLLMLVLIVTLAITWGIYTYFTAIF